MKIEKILLNNFRCFDSKGVEFTLDNTLTTLVGGNGSGKTAVLQAISRLFGTSSAQRSIQRRDFHIPSDRKELLSGDKLAIEACLGFPELEDPNKSSLNAVPEFFNQMSVSGEGNPPKVQIRLEATWTDDGTPEGAIEEEIRWVRPDCPWESCPRVQPAERSSIQFIYLPANRDATTQVTSLLKGRLWQAAKWSPEFKNKSAEKAEEIQKDFSQEKPSEFLLERLSKRWCQVHTADTDSTPCLRLLDSSFEELVRKAEFTFKPDEANQEHHLFELSDGQRSLFHIALTAATLEAEQDALGTDDSLFEQDKLHRVYLTILAIEEPENSLSPFFLSRIVKLSREIGGFSSAQVLLSSHSPAILSRIEPEEVRYLRLNHTTRSSCIHPLHLPESADDARRYVRLAVKAHPELYFARFVILGEGDSERFIIPQLAEKMGISLDPSFVAVVPLGGRFVTHFWTLLNDLNIPYATLLDLDLGRQHGGVKTIRSCFNNLQILPEEKQFWKDSSYKYPEVTPDAIDKLTDQDLLDASSTNWFKAFQENGIFFSHPLDLDFAMLCAFPDAYQASRSDGDGPKNDSENIQKKKTTTLKKRGTPSLYPSSYDITFLWYPYLFLSHSKPETHLAAFSYIQETDIAASIPAELKALIKYAERKLNLSGDSK